MIEVLVNDSKSGGYEKNTAYFAEIDAWAKEFCTGYQGYHIQDVSDVSYQWDEIAAYRFNDEKGSNWFKLKWLSE
jgi:hypothetical protein